MKNYMMEFIGTFFLVLAFAMTGSPIAVGLVLMALLYIGESVSGAHYNPAVTLTFLLLRKISFIKSLFYWIVQLLGGFSAAALYQLINNKRFIPAPNFEIVLWKPILIELLLTTLLCTVVATVCFAKRFEAVAMYGVIVGLTFAGIMFVGSPISGGIFNPAVAIGPMFFDFLRGGSSFLNYPIYIAGPFGGAICAVIMHKFVSGE